MKKIYVLIGNFGSGKTELSLNFAFRAAECGRTELIDLDMVNTYFRLSERRKIIEASEIRLVSPNYVSTNVETLSLPPEVSSAFDMDWDTVVFDVGGDPVGATALGRYYGDFSDMPPGSVEVLNVVNARRPLSGTADAIEEMTFQLQKNSRLRITGFINNTNLAGETTKDDLRFGYELLREASTRTGIPVAYTTGTPEVLEAFLLTGPDPVFVGTPMEIETYMHRDWDTYVRIGLFDE